MQSINNFDWSWYKHIVFDKLKCQCRVSGHIAEWAAKLNKLSGPSASAMKYQLNSFYKLFHLYAT